MLVYWVMLGFPALFALIEQSARRINHRVNFVWVTFALILTIFIGLRWKTGGDWGNYYANLEPFYYLHFSEVVSKDIGFSVLSEFATLFPAGIIVITVFSGIVMASALVRFSIAQPRPWLCLTVAMPYLVVVGGMGYIRQGIAISFVMIGMVALQRGSVVRFVTWVLVGALFHSTAIILLPLAAIISKQNRVLTFGLGLIVTYIAYRGLVADRATALVNAYVDTEAGSSGALVRSFITALPAALYLVFRDKFDLQGQYRTFWNLLAMASVATVPLALLFSSSTVIDRLALYLLPAQCFFYCRLPDALGQTAQHRQLIGLLVVLLYLVIFFIFINYADHAHSWVPYRFYPFEDGICLECGMAT